MRMSTPRRDAPARRHQHDRRHRQCSTGRRAPARRAKRVGCRAPLECSSAFGAAHRSGPASREPSVVRPTNPHQAAARRSSARCRPGPGRSLCGRHWNRSRCRQARAHGGRSWPRGHRDRRERSDHAVARTVGVLHDVDRPVLGECSHRFRLMREERGLPEQPLVTTARPSGSQGPGDPQRGAATPRESSRACGSSRRLPSAHISGAAEIRESNGDESRGGCQSEVSHLITVSRRAS
jgi:hypothetical protein